MSTTDALGEKRPALREREGETVLMIHAVPEQIKSHFKAACAAKGLQMRDVMLGFMELYAKTHLPLKEKAGAS